jgi:hypothetical protein
MPELFHCGHSVRFVAAPAANSAQVRAQKAAIKPQCDRSTRILAYAEPQADGKAGTYQEHMSSPDFGGKLVENATEPLPRFQQHAIPRAILAI